MVGEVKGLIGCLIGSVMRGWWVRERVDDVIVRVLRCDEGVGGEVKET